MTIRIDTRISVNFLGLNLGSAAYFFITLGKLLNFILKFLIQLKKNYGTHLLKLL